MVVMLDVIVVIKEEITVKTIIVVEIVDQTNKNRQGKGKYIQEDPLRNRDDLCYKCKKKGHWYKVCRTLIHYDLMGHFSFSKCSWKK